MFVEKQFADEEDERDGLHPTCLEELFYYEDMIKTSSYCKNMRRIITMYVDNRED